MQRMILKAESLFVHPINLICVPSAGDGHVIADATFPLVWWRKNNVILLFCKRDVLERESIHIVFTI